MISLNHFTEFHGRISRQPFWIGGILLAISQTIFIFVLRGIIATGPLFRPSYIDSADLLAKKSLEGMIGLFVFAILFYPTFAITNRRLEDRGRSIWWNAFYFAPSVLWFCIEILKIGHQLHVMKDGRLIGLPTMVGGVVILTSLATGIFGLVDLGLMHGSDGPNQFGPDPLQH